MSAEDNPPASQADVGEALVAALGFEPTEGIKQGRKGSTTASTGQRRSKKSRRRNRGGTAGNGGSGGRGSGRATATSNIDTNGSEAQATDPTGNGAEIDLNGDAGDDKIVEGVKSALDEIKSAAKPSVSDRSKIIVGGHGDDLEDGWVAVDAPADDQSDDDTATSAPDTDSNAASAPDVEATADAVVEETTEASADEPVSGDDEADTQIDPSADGSAAEARGAAGDVDATVEIATGIDADLPEGGDGALADVESVINIDDDTVVSGPPAAGPVTVGLVDDGPGPAGNGAAVDAGPVAVAAAATGEIDPAAIGAAGTTTTVGDAGTIEVAPGVAAPTGPPIVAEAPPTGPPRVGSPEPHPAHTGEIQRVETRDDEIQSARLEAEAKAREEGREIFRQGSWINLFRRSRRLQSRKVRRVVRHIDPWSVLTFSVLFHLCVFAALLLASVLVWNAAEAAGTIEDLEGFILELGDYETFEIKGDVVFRAAVAIAGILTLASSVLLVLLTVVFNLISDLVGGIRMTVIEEETVRVRRRKASAEAEAAAG